MKFTLGAALGLAVLVAACGKSATAPSSVAAPTVTETFTGTIGVGGFSFYSFVIAANGTVNVTMNSITGDNIPATVTVLATLGIPSGTSCLSNQTANIQAGTSPGLVGTIGPGTFCVMISDIGNLTGPATFNVTIAHP